MNRGRKPRSWVRLDCQGVLHGSINYIYTLEEQAVFIKMIAMAEVYGQEPGLISDNDGRALPKEYVAHELHCSVEMLDSVIKKGSADEAISENGSGIKLLHFEHYQFTEYDRQSKYRQKKAEEKKQYGEFKNVLLTDIDYKKLTDKFGEVKTKALIEKLSEGIKRKGYKYKDFYLTILDWEKRDAGTGTHKESSKGQSKDFGIGKSLFEE